MNNLTKITIEDPDVYTQPCTSGLDMRWMPDRELFEYICQDINVATPIMI